MRMAVPSRGKHEQQRWPAHLQRWAKQDGVFQYVLRRNHTQETGSLEASLDSINAFAPSVAYNNLPSHATVGGNVRMTMMLRL